MSKPELHEFFEPTAWLPLIAGQTYRGAVRVSAPETKVGRIAAFIFGWLYENGYIDRSMITVGYIYDDELEFLEAFMKAFPGRKRFDYDAGKRRLAKYLNQLYRDGWLLKRQRYNDAWYLGEARSGWYPTFSLPLRAANQIEQGAQTADEMGRRYGG